jgi:hypothetical protein
LVNNSPGAEAIRRAEQSVDKVFRFFDGSSL